MRNFAAGAGLGVLLCRRHGIFLCAAFRERFIGLYRSTDIGWRECVCDTITPE